jgi:hypothetical protein
MADPSTLSVRIRPLTSLSDAGRACVEQSSFARIRIHAGSCDEFECPPTSPITIGHDVDLQFFQRGTRRGNVGAELRASRAFVPGGLYIARREFEVRVARLRSKR